jgi:citrate synthase
MTDFIQRLPREAHPMTMLSQSVLYLQNNSTFAKHYYVGKATKAHYWEYFYEDSVDLIAKLPRVAALVYRHKYHNDKFIESNNSLDWAGNYASMLGFS